LFKFEVRRGAEEVRREKGQKRDNIGMIQMKKEIIGLSLEEEQKR